MLYIFIISFNVWFNLNKINSHTYFCTESIAICYFSQYVKKIWTSHRYIIGKERVL